MFPAEDYEDIIIHRVTEEVMDDVLVELSYVAKWDKDYRL